VWHWPPLEAPDKVNRLIGDLLRRLTLLSAQNSLSSLSLSSTDQFGKLPFITFIW
jgi:hypothetical protein